MVILDTAKAGSVYTGGAASGLPIEREFLQAMRERWFGGG